ncbi:MAG: DUF4129 domain-containing protein, partial [Firmicutes bacterium]|nr:DUF4129 domain-containing protein [Bacillota bacterium]
PYGWVPVDPTPGYQLPAATKSSQTGTTSVSSASPASVPAHSKTSRSPSLVPASPPTAIPAPDKSALARSSHHPSHKSRVQAEWFGEILLLLAGLLPIGWKLRQQKIHRDRTLSAFQIWQRIGIWSRRHYHLPPKNLTPRQWAQQMAVKRPDLSRSLHALADQVEPLLYSGHAPSESSLSLLQAWIHLRRRLAHRPRHPA